MATDKPIPAVAAPGETNAADLEKEWLTQDKILDYRNWLQAELLKARAAPTPSSTQARLPNQTFLEDEIAQVLTENCTGEDDHDPEPCPKCERMQEELVAAVSGWYRILATPISDSEREKK